MSIIDQEGLTFDDICLVPQHSNIPSRHIPVVETWLAKKTRTSIPIIPSNMDTVISPRLSTILEKIKAQYIVNRKSVKFIRDGLLGQFVGNKWITWGINDIDQLITILLEREKYLISGVCLDIAHGHSAGMMSAIEKVKKLTKVEVIAGNVCTPLGYHDLVNAGADAVKVGVGCGAACTTRMVTGFGVPQFTAIYECGKLAQKLRVPIIADGGIRSSRDIVLALAAGASSVMIGKLFAATEESAAKTVMSIYPDKFYEYLGMGLNGLQPCWPFKRYRGHASADYQVDFYGQCSHTPEGESFWTPCTGSAEKLISELVGGIRSGMSYGGAMDIKELQRKAEFVRVTSTYQAESNVRP